MATRGDAARDVTAERARQDAKWGEQNHSDGTGKTAMPLGRIVYHGPAVPENGDMHYAFGLALMAKRATDRAAQAGTVTWADILLEEVFEALAEDDAEGLRAELVQVAAVAQQWVEAIDRRGPIAPVPELTVLLGDFVAFVGSSREEGPYACHWDFGDGSESWLDVPQHRYDAVGDYVAKVTMTWFDGHCETQSMLVRVVPS